MRTNTQPKTTKESSLFEIPNPFDDFQREKKGISKRHEEQKELGQEFLESLKAAKNKAEKK